MEAVYRFFRDQEVRRAYAMGAPDRVADLTDPWFDWNRAWDLVRAHELYAAHYAAAEVCLPARVLPPRRPLLTDDAMLRAEVIRLNFLRREHAHAIECVLHELHRARHAFLRRFPSHRLPPLVTPSSPREVLASMCNRLSEVRSLSKRLVLSDKQRRAAEMRRFMARRPSANTQALVLGNAEIVANILLFVSAKSRIGLFRVCSAWRELFRTQARWLLPEYYAAITKAGAAGLRTPPPPPQAPEEGHRPVFVLAHWQAHGFLCTDCFVRMREKRRKVCRACRLG